MFLKRDNGSPLNCAAFDQVLEHPWVLPLNSPPQCPRYNGSIERNMQDFNGALDARRLDALNRGTSLALQVERVTHQLNHRRLRLHAATREAIFREVFQQYWQYVQCMPERTRHNLNAAWRLVVETWLRRQDWITVRDNAQTNVSTNSDPFFSQN